MELSGRRVKKSPQLLFLISIFIFGMVPFLGGLTSCASYDQKTAGVKSDFSKGQYGEALEKLETSPIATSKLAKLLYFLEKAMILDRLERLKDSRKLFLDGERLATELYTTSISKETLTYLYNDTAQEYAGEDYEKIAIHTMLALSFLESKNLKSALVEARRINSRIEEINNQYEDRKNAYNDDAFARFLAGMIYESNEKLDDAIISYSQALSTYETSYKKLFSTPPPANLLSRLRHVLEKRKRTAKLKELDSAYPNIAEDKGVAHIAVIHELGTIASKQAEEFLIPIGSQIIRISFPVIRPNRSPEPNGIAVIINGKNDSQPYLAQNMDSIASETLEDRRLRMILKQGARLLVKGQITEQARQNFGALGGIAANLYSAISETADTRSWSLLPSQFYVSVSSVEPGEISYQFKNAGRLSDLKKIKVKKGDFILLRNKP